MPVHVRLTLLVGDPLRLGTAMQFLADETPLQVESEEGSLGMSLHENTELGVAVVESYWSSAEAMRATEAVVSLAAEAARRSTGTLSVEQYEVALWTRRMRPHPGAGVRLTRLETDPARVDEAIEAYARLALPWLTETDGFCMTQLLVDRGSGRWIGETLWRDANALAASRSAAAGIRVGTAGSSGSVVRALEEYRLVFSSLRAEPADAPGGPRAPGGTPPAPPPG
jgi:hypothetical protein